MQSNIRYIVEVRLLDSINRVKKSRVLGVWKTLEVIPIDRIRSLNESAYPKNRVEIKVTPHSDLTWNLTRR